MTTGEAATTAVVSINPQGQEAYNALHAQALELRTNSMSLLVQDLATVTAASSDLALLKSLGNQIEAMRKQYVDPLNAHVKAINDVFKPLTGLISEAEATVKAKIKAYNEEQARIKAEAERIERLRQEAEAAAAKLAAETGQPATPPPEPAAPLPISHEARAIKTETGSIHTRQIPKWELLDFDKVPDKYKVLDSVKIGKLVRAGEREIPGIRIWLEDEISVVPKGATFMGSVKAESSIAEAPAIVESKPELGIPF